MRIKSYQFCGLATSAKWQSWLRDYDPKLHADFKAKMEKSHGCTQNTVIMSWVLKQIQADEGGEEKLMSFLNDKFPYVLDAPVRLKKANAFGDFYTNVLTFPRRHIMQGEGLEDRVKEFLKGKLVTDHIIIDGVAYIEYLNSTDKHLQNKIPENNWRIAAYRKDN